MRTKWVTMMWAGVMVGLLLAGEASAHRRTIAGSVSITGPEGAALDTGALVGVAVTANPGLEKVITQHLPPFTLPVFIDEDLIEDESAGSSSRPRLRLLRRHLDTVLVLTNPNTVAVTLELTLWDASGSQIAGPTTHVLGPRQTRIVPLSDLLQ